MGEGIIKRLLGSLRAAGDRIPDVRRGGNALRYRITDALMCAFAVFFFLYPSLLHFQRAMKTRRRRTNLETLFGVSEIPCDNTIRELMDGIAPEALSGVFMENLRTAEEEGALKEYRVLDGGVLVALDGLWYHGSEKVRCEHCQHITKDGETTYYHSAVAGAVVRPGSTRVIPVVPELIRNEDGKEKQDCERNAGKRWLRKHGKEYAWLEPTLLGDDLYANQPFCEAVVKEKLHFIFTCKPASHPWLYETVENSYREEKRAERWDGHYHIVSTWQWVNGVPLRDTKDALTVNYMYFEMRRRETGEVVYKNSWITDKEVREENVELLAACGRARWKIENEHNNVLKNRGYNLQHNFGHGENHACEIFFILNLIGFQLHTILELGDKDFREARKYAGRRDMFFYEMHAALRYVLHETWRDFLVFIRAEDDLE